MTTYNKMPNMCAACKYSSDENIINPDFVYCKVHKIEVRKNKPSGICSSFIRKDKGSKYKNVRTMVDCILFDSKRESERYKELKLLQEAGEIKFFLRQIPFDLGAGVKYRADFMIFWADGRVTIEDVKGIATKEFKLKKKLVESRYPIEIVIVK